MENKQPKLADSYMTLGILIVLLIVFLVETFIGGSTNTTVLVKMGAMYNPLIAINHQFWRLFTAQFLHIGLLHLASNAVMILYLGRYIEPVIGHWRFLLIYLVSGIGGNLLSFAYGNDYSISAGASTALFGMIGTLIALYFRNKNVPLINLLGRQALVLGVVNLVLDLFMKDVDILGHAGGLISGVMLVIICGTDFLPKEKKQLRLIVGVVFILYVILCLRNGMVITQ